MRGKPRGNVSGLLELRSSQKKENTAAMLLVIRRLRENKPDVKWTYKEVWSGAGLKSQIALDSHWNAHVRAEIDAHNSLLRSGAPSTSTPALSRTERDLVMSLRAELRICKEQRNQALSRIAQYSADAEYYRAEYEKLKRTVKNLKAEH